MFSEVAGCFEKAVDLRSLSDISDSFRKRFGDTMRTTKLARWLSVSDTTIKAWCAEYEDFLSPRAVGGDGRRRYFDDRDSRILSHVARLRSESVRTEDIRAALAQLQKDDWHNLPEMPPAPTNVAPVSMIPREAAETTIAHQRAALVREIALQQDRIETLEGDLAAERGAHNDTRAALMNARERLGKLEGQLSERMSVQNTMRLVAVVALITLLATIAVVAVVLLTSTP